MTCSSKLSLSCSDCLVKVKCGNQYYVWNNFSLFYNAKIYNQYQEYRLNHNNFEMCVSNNSRIQAVWRSRYSWEEHKDLLECLALGAHHHFKAEYYVVNEQFTIYSAFNGQYFARNDYMVVDGKPLVCKEKLRPNSSEYTKEDLLKCNDSIINIKYNDEYRVMNNFSVLYQNRTFDYTEYRVLDDSIKICNSTDNYARDIWKMRNSFVKSQMHGKNCRNPALYSSLSTEYVVTKHFNIYLVICTCMN